MTSPVSQRPGRQHGPGLICFLFCLLLSGAGKVSANVWLLDINGAIGPATADYVSRGLSEAAQARTELVVLRINTPGGLDSAMRDIVQAILSSPVPVAAYVGPAGARAASAGTYILYASHIAAMAPATNIGAATPVRIGSPMPTMPGADKRGADKRGMDKRRTDKQGANKRGTNDPSPDEPNADNQPYGAEQQPATLSPMEKKIINDAASYITGLAELRGRNARWAEQAVRSGVSLTAEQALENNVIEWMADSVPSLLEQLDGHTLSIDGQQLTLNTAGAPVNAHQPDWRTEFLSVITDPNIAYILMLIGIYGLLFEFSNPGLGVPGVLGAVCLLLALYAFQVLPISYTGLGLIFLGIALITAEAFVPSFGVLGIGGVVALVIGSVILMDTELPAYQIALPMVLAVAVVFAGLMLWVLKAALRSRKSAVVSGSEALLGQTATVEAIHGGVPMARITGELWQVSAGQPLHVGDRIKVQDIDGLKLSVQKL